MEQHEFIYLIRNLSKQQQQQTSSIFTQRENNQNERRFESTRNGTTQYNIH